MPQNPHNPNQRISRLAILASFGVHHHLISEQDASTIASMNGVINWAFFCPDSPNSVSGKVAAVIVNAMKESGADLEAFKNLSDPNA